MADTVDGTNPAVEEGTPFPGADGDAANDGGGQPRIKRRTSLQAVKEAIKQQPLPNTKLPTEGPNSSFKLVFRSAIAEFVAALFYTYIGTGAVIHSNTDLNVALAHGFAAYALCHTTGHLSGGHFGNPMISFTMLLQRRLSVPEFFVYFLFQFLGALVGAAFLLGAVIQPSFVGETRAGAVNDITGELSMGVLSAGCNNNVEGQSTLALFLSELLASFFISMVLLAVVDPVTQLSPTSGPHVIGMAVAAMHLASEHVVSANPTHSLAVAIINFDVDGSGNPAVCEKIGMSGGIPQFWCIKPGTAPSAAEKQVGWSEAGCRSLLTNAGVTKSAK
eukprot:gene16431-9968_t